LFDFVYSSTFTPEIQELSQHCDLFTEWLNLFNPTRFMLGSIIRHLCSWTLLDNVCDRLQYPHIFHSLTFFQSKEILSVPSCWQAEPGFISVSVPIIEDEDIFDSHYYLLLGYLEQPVFIFLYSKICKKKYLPSL
jgi:hypothetical protein